MRHLYSGCLAWALPPSLTGTISYACHGGSYVIRPVQQVALYLISTQRKVPNGSVIHILKCLTNRYDAKYMKTNGTKQKHNCGGKQTPTGDVKTTIVVYNALTHWRRIAHIYANKTEYDSCRIWFAATFAQSHDMKQRCFINFTLGTSKKFSILHKFS